MERGGEVDLDDQMLRRLQHAREKVSSYAQSLSMKLFEERTEHLQVQESCYQDVLIRCAVSDTTAWLRLQYRSTGSQNPVTSLLKPEFSVGCSMLVTNIRPGHSAALHSGFTLPILHTCDTSTMRVLPNPTIRITPVSDRDLPRSVVPSPLYSSPISAATPPKPEVSVISHRGVKHLFSLRCLQPSPTHTSADPQQQMLCTAHPGSEISCTFVLTDWHLEDSNNTDATTQLTIFGVGGDRHGVVLYYTVPTELTSKLSWLIPNACVTVSNAVLVQVDLSNDIVRLMRGDHTVVALTHSETASYPHTRVGYSGTSSSIGSGSKTMYNQVSGVKRRYQDSGTIPSGPAMVTPGTAVSTNTQQFKRPRRSTGSSSVIPSSTSTSNANSSAVSFRTPGRAIAKSHTVTSFVTPFTVTERSNNTTGATTVGTTVTTVQDADSSITNPTPTTSPTKYLLQELPWVVADERRRYEALRDGTGCFVPSRNPHDLERCERITLPTATITVSLPFTTSTTATTTTTCSNQHDNRTTTHLHILDESTQTDREVIADTALLQKLLANLQQYPPSLRLPQEHINNYTPKSTENHHTTTINNNSNNTNNTNNTTISEHTATKDNAAVDSTVTTRKVRASVVLSQCYHLTATSSTTTTTTSTNDSNNNRTNTTVDSQAGGEIKLFWKLVWLSPVYTCTTTATSSTNTII